MTDTQPATPDSRPRWQKLNAFALRGLTGRFSVPAELSGLGFPVHGAYLVPIDKRCACGCLVHIDTPITTCLACGATNDG